MTLNAGGPLTIGGGADVSGGPSSAGGSIALTGGTVTTGQLNASGGNGSNQIRSGGPGGSIRVSAADGASLGKLLAYGGQSYGGTAGGGGSINVSSSAGSIAATSAETEGGYQGDGPGAAGGPIALSAAGNLSVGADVDADGSDAGGQSDPPFNGGNAGSLTLRAAAGTLSLGGNASAQGGTGGNPNKGTLGGTGGTGGETLVVTHALGALASLSSAGGQGGDYGDSQGPGGRGGALLAFTNAPIFNDQELVSSDGGNGNPTGAAGPQQQDESPTAPVIVPSTGALSFTSQSPLAQRYQVLMSVAGGAAVPVLTTSHTTGSAAEGPGLRAGDVHRRGARLLGRLDLRPLVRGLLSPPAVKEPGMLRGPEGHGVCFAQPLAASAPARPLGRDISGQDERGRPDRGDARKGRCRPGQGQARQAPERLRREDGRHGLAGGRRLRDPRSAPRAAGRGASRRQLQPARQSHVA